jgi:Acetyltransferase (GNAT) domain
VIVSRINAGELDDPVIRSRWDRAVGETTGIDPWCSHMAWQLSVHDAFGNDPERFGPAPSEDHDVVGVGDDHPYGYALKATTFIDGTPALLPLDPMWGFASPLVAGTHILEEAAEALAVALYDEPRWKLAFLAGIEPSSELDDRLLWQLQSVFGRTVRLIAGEETIRCVASLDGGMEGYLANRSREFRRNVRQAERRAEQSNVYIRSLHVDEDADGTGDIDYTEGISRAAVLELMMSIEHRSWKGRADSGITSPAMQTLYRRLLGRLPDAAVRFSVAYQGTRPIGFVLGGVLGGVLVGQSSTYRGLQISFDDDFRDLSIGTLLQINEIKRLCAEGVARYDLGMDMEYKQRWAERQLLTRPIIVVRHE